MHRRSALRQLAIILGGISLTPEIMANALAKASNGTLPGTIGADRILLLAEIADTIIPETDTPGAKAAGVPAFIAIMVEDCLAPADQKVFWDGLDAVQVNCNKQFGLNFEQCDAANRTVLLKELEKMAKGAPAPNFWQMLKGMTLFGYFSSEIGMTQALEYDPIPGQWIPDMPINETTKAWASMF